ncbi:unnamed protein product [Ectocarpus sp. 4 AP-2014]
MGVLMCVVIMALSALIALLTEAYSWYTVYRKPEYQRLKRQIENLVKDVEKKKAEPVGGSVERKVKNLKALSRLEKDLAEATKDLQALTMSNKLVVAVTLMVVMVAINKRYVLLCGSTSRQRVLVTLMGSGGRLVLLSLERVACAVKCWGGGGVVVWLCPCR